MVDRTVTLNDGNTMPRVGYGVWQLSDTEAQSLLKVGIEAGFRHIDTAQAYFNEAGVGRAIHASDVPREELFVTSKLRGRDMGHDQALKSFDETLARMKLDYLDLFLIHWPMPRHDRYVETWKAFIELQKSGRVRSIGVSNFTPAHVDRLFRETGVTPAVNQLEVHPYFQQRGVRGHHRDAGIVIQSYSPLGGGGSGILRNDVMRDIAAKHARSPAQAVIRWHLQQDLVPLPKTVTASRLPENLAVWDFELDDDDMARLGKLDRPNGNTQPSPDSMNSPF
jgi:2,5-diketo-D-gluconate reductase A